MHFTHNALMHFTHNETLCRLILWVTSLAHFNIIYINIENIIQSMLLLFSCQVVFDSSRPHGLQHTKLPRPSSSPRVCPKYAAAAAKSLQSCSTLCDPIDGSPPGFPVSGILQARTLEWVAMSFSNA